MTVYKHTGSGLYIGSVVVVIAYTPSQAQIMIRNYLDEAGLKDEALNIEEIELLEPCILYAQNGDY